MYTSELSDFLANLISTAFILVFLGGLLYGYINKCEPVKFGILEDLKKGKIPLGYIDDDSELVDYNDHPIVATVEIVKKKKKKKKKREKEIGQHDETFTRECVSVLVGLGVKGAVAKRNVNDFLDKNPEVKTVEEFIEGIFKK